MAATHRILIALAIGSAVAAQPAVAQAGSSVSLTHTVTVTVPPRVKVQVASNSVMTQAQPAAVSRSTEALKVSVDATRSWVLSVGAARGNNRLEWSNDAERGFSRIAEGNAPVASGLISQVQAAPMLFVRRAGAGSSEHYRNEVSDAVVLTVVAP